MRRLNHLALGLMGMALTVPASARALDDPPASAPVAVVPATLPAPAPHKHHGLFHRGLMCEKCAEARAAKAGVVSPAAGLPEGTKIVGCSHSANGVCPSCRKLLEMPGQVMVVGPNGTAAPAAPTVASASASAPGRAVISDAVAGHAVADAAEPMPVGVMRTDYMPKAAGMPGAQARPAMPMPSQAGSAPYMPPKPESQPHILGHLFGWSDIGNGYRDMSESRAKKKREAHAAISYGDGSGKVEELPASMVYGKK